MAESDLIPVYLRIVGIIKLSIDSLNTMLYNDRVIRSIDIRKELLWADTFIKRPL
jgi:hypothetical protein